MAPLGLYIHVPFCAAICAYCNFTRGLLDEALRDRYVEAVIAEIRRSDTRAAIHDGADTVFFGGGTPSLLPPAAVHRILDACRDVWALPPDAEITIEANPESVTPAALTAWRSAGVTRLSIGAQSFHDDELARLGRIHNAARISRAVQSARAAGFDNLSLDLMMALPGQQPEAWAATVEAALQLAPEHLSLYMLELYAGAPLRAAMTQAGWAAVDDDGAADMYEAAMTRLESAGYDAYEVSNVARPGCRCRHNMKYWTDGAWIGFGPGAHSTYDNVRWHNVVSTHEYVRRINAHEDVGEGHRRLSRDDRWREALMMGLRLYEGISVKRWQHDYGLDLLAEYGHDLQPYLDHGLVVLDAGQLRLTRRGMLIANHVTAVFF